MYTVNLVLEKKLGSYGTSYALWPFQRNLHSDQCLVILWYRLNSNRSIWSFPPTISIKNILENPPVEIINWLLILNCDKFSYYITHIYLMWSSQMLFQKYTTAMPQSCYLWPMIQWDEKFLSIKVGLTLSCQLSNPPVGVNFVVLL